MSCPRSDGRPAAALCFGEAPLTSSCTAQHSTSHPQTRNGSVDIVSSLDGRRASAADKREDWQTVIEGKDGGGKWVVPPYPVRTFSWCRQGMTESKSRQSKEVRTHPPRMWRVRVVVVTSVQSQKESTSNQQQQPAAASSQSVNQSRSGCPCICILHWPLPNAAPGPDPCALGRETVAPPVQDEPCTGGDGLLGLLGWVGAHSALCSRRTRNPSFQGPVRPGPHVPQSCSACACACAAR